MDNQTVVNVALPLDVWVEAAELLANLPEARDAILLELMPTEERWTL